MMHGFASKGRALHDDGDADIGDVGGRREIGQPLEMSLEGDEGFGKRHWIFGHVELIFCWSKI